MFRSKVNALAMLLDPVAFGVLLLLLASIGSTQEEQVRSAFGAGLMGFWTVVLFSSGQMFYDLRQLGVLETMLAAPMPVIVAVAGPMLVSTTLGAFSLIAILVIARALFGFPIDLSGWPMLSTNIVVCMLALAALGMCVSAVFFVMRDVFSWTNVLQFPLWLLSGLTAVPLNLPMPLYWLSQTLPTTWTMRAYDVSTSGGSPAGDIMMCGLLAVMYLALSLPLVQWMERRARVSATLSLV